MLTAASAAEKKQHQVKKASYVESNLFKSALLCLIVFGIPRLRNMFLTFKYPKPDRRIFLLLRLSCPSSNIRPGMPSSHPSDISLASGPGAKMRQEVEVPHTTGISIWIEGPWHCWLSQQIASQIISYSFQSFPSHLIQSWSQPLPNNTLAAPLHSSKSWTNAGSLSLKVLQYFPTIRFHS